MMPRRCDPLDKRTSAIVTLVSVIDASIAAQRPQPTANARKTGRDMFWNEVLAIWISIGGEATGIAAGRVLGRHLEAGVRHSARYRRAQDDGQHAAGLRLGRRVAAAARQRPQAVTS